MTIESFAPEILVAARDLLDKEQRASVGLLQRRLRLEHVSAIGLMESLQVEGVVGPLQDGVRRLTPRYEKPETASRARFIRALFEIARFFFEMWEEDSNGHTGAIKAMKPVPAVDSVELRKLVLDDYYRRQHMTVGAAALSLLEWLRGKELAPDLNEADYDDLGLLCASAERPFVEVRDDESINRRAFIRLIRFLCKEYLDGGAADSRSFEHFLTDFQTPTGFAKSGGSGREHVVPLALLRDRAFGRFGLGATVADVARELGPFFVIVKITEEERKRMDNGPALGGLGLKSKMPGGWSFDGGDPYARLRLAGIDFDQPDTLLGLGEI